VSVAVARTAEGWWVVTGHRLTRVATEARTTAALLADRAAVDAAAAHPDPKGPPLEGATLLSPVTMPARVVAQMVNYRTHAREAGFDPDAILPTFFRKSESSVSGPSDDIRCPPHVQLLDYEVELGLVLKQRLELGAVVTPEDLPELVGGLVVTNDVSARDVQLPQGQFYEGKSYPTFTPVGPYLVLPDAETLAHLDRLRLTLEVNGEPRQDQRLSDMIVTPAEALTRLARFQELDPGDLLLTGTPGGTALVAPPKLVLKLASLLPPALRWKLLIQKQSSNPRYLRDGDVVTARIVDEATGLDLGTQRTAVRGGGRA
jgi:2-keto-4-pentenoate hydratase/2-oxohepta-3-ene-1,7-dioic acid hydratase in catechol pathway